MLVLLSEVLAKRSVKNIRISTCFLLALLEDVMFAFIFPWIIFERPGPSAITGAKQCPISTISRPLLYELKIRPYISLSSTNKFDIPAVLIQSEIQPLHATSNQEKQFSDLDASPIALEKHILH